MSVSRRRSRAAEARRDRRPSTTFAMRFARIAYWPVPPSFWR